MVVAIAVAVVDGSWNDEVVDNEGATIDNPMRRRSKSDVPGLDKEREAAVSPSRYGPYGKHAMGRR